MFVIYDKTTHRVPIKVWLPDATYLEAGCFTQAENLSRLPFAFRHIALMPDTHQGYGMPIGGVLATTDDVIIPNAVGVDIACGVRFVKTNVPVSLLREVMTPNGDLLQNIVGQIMRNVPVGFEHHKSPISSQLVRRYNQGYYGQLFHLGQGDLPEIEDANYQIGTLGGGNHFIEFQADEDDYVCIMVHSGSRNFGHRICRYFNGLAKELNKKESSVPSRYNLAYLYTTSEVGKGYVQWMNLALDFAKENRQVMMDVAKDILYDALNRYTDFRNIKEEMEVDAHHNYGALEEHFGQRVWVHRKGAIRAGKDEFGIIPGAMGSFSYIVQGLGNPESFHSCSHGAGRAYGRKAAYQKFTVEEVMADFKRQNIVLGKRKKKDIVEEYHKAYKDIDFVMENQKDLVTPILKLRTIAVIKG
ncbi:MAG: RtcB family protein [Limnochordia bacterium]|jgi:tRNA-splicing ligase RtcB